MPTLRTQDATLGDDVTENGSTQTLVLLHSFPLDRTLWRGQWGLPARTA